MAELLDRRALVTGGGRGIGKAIALELARAGARLALLARTRSELDEVAAEIDALGREECRVVVADFIAQAISVVDNLPGPSEPLVVLSECLTRQLELLDD